MLVNAPSARSLPRLGTKQLVLAAVIVGLSAVVVYSAVREVRKQAAPAPAVSAAAAFSAGIAMGEHPAARALTPEEEAYAAALWPIHSEVKLAAVRMTFAGLNYKIEHGDARTVKQTVQPLTKTFLTASERTRRIAPPESLQDAHRKYLEALDHYATASREMIKIADDGSERHLLAAHARSEQASHALLELSDVLWPGEYKPN